MSFALRILLSKPVLVKRVPEGRFRHPRGHPFNFPCPQQCSVTNDGGGRERIKLQGIKKFHHGMVRRNTDRVGSPSFRTRQIFLHLFLIHRNDTQYHSLHLGIVQKTIFFQDYIKRFPRSSITPHAIVPRSSSPEADKYGFVRRQARQPGMIEPIQLAEKGRVFLVFLHRPHFLHFPRRLRLNFLSYLVHKGLERLRIARKLLQLRPRLADGGQGKRLFHIPKRFLHVALPLPEFTHQTPGKGSFLVAFP